MGSKVEEAGLKSEREPAKTKPHMLSSQAEAENLSQRLQNITNNLPGVVFRYHLEPDGKDYLEYVSQGAEAIWGISAEAAMQDNQQIWARYDPRDLSAHRASVAHSAQTLSFWSHEWRFHHPDGSLRWHRGQGQPLQLADGSIIWDSLITDITAQKTTEAQLQQTLEALNERIKEQKCLYQILRLNEQELSLEDLLQQAVDLIPSGFRFPELTTAAIRFGDKVFTSPHYLASKWCLSTHNQRVSDSPLQINVCYLEACPPADLGPFLHEEQRLLDSLADHLALKVQQQETQQRLKLLESVVTHTKDAVLITEAAPLSPPGPRIIYANQAFEAMTGYSAAEVLGQTPRLLQGPQTQTAELERMSQALRNFQACEVELINYKKNGEPFWIQLAITPVTDHRGQCSHFFAIERDISEQKQREQQSELLNQIFHLAPDVLCVSDLEGRFQRVNPAMAELFGYTEPELLQMHVQDLLDPETLTLENLPALQRTATAYTRENRYLTRQGQIKWLAWTSVCSEQDKLVYSVARDITAKKALELRLEKAYALAQMGTWEFDLKTNMAHWSHFTRQIYEVSDPNFHPNLEQALKFYQPADHPRLQAAAEQCLASGQPWDLEIQIITAKGRLRWVRSLGEAELENGQCRRLFGSIMDIHARKTAEIERENKTQLLARLVDANQALLSEKSTILESIGDGFVTLDPDYVVTYWNQQAEALTQVPRSQVIKKCVWDIFGDLLEDYKPHYDRAMREQVPVHFESYFKRLNCWFEVSAYPSKIGLAVYFHDITERKNTEAELKTLNQQLQIQAKALATSNQELEQFAYVASHDLQEPLRMVSSFLTQLEKKYGELLDDKGRKYIYFAVDGATRMRQIILDLLEFSRVSKIEAATEAVDLNEVLTDISLLLRKKIHDSQAQLNWERLPTLKVPQAPISQLFQNLIENALKYHQPGRPPQIQIAAKEVPQEWVFSVSDNGLGIESEYFDKIFIIFQRLHPQQEYAGTGMGLAICKKIVENLGGKIWLASEPGKGSVFYFSIKKQGFEGG